MKSKLPAYFFLFLVIGVSLLFFGLIANYMMGVFWAIALTVLFSPVYQKLLKKWNDRRNLSAAATVAIVLLLFIIPATFLIAAVIVEGQSIVERVEEGDVNIQEQVTAFADKVPAKLREWGLPVDRITESLSGQLTSFTQGSGKKILSFTQGVLGFMIQLAVALYLLFFLLRDGKEIKEAALKAIPLKDEKESKLLSRFDAVVRATMKGSLMIALIQGLLGGILFTAVGVPGAIVLGALMVIASLLPVGGVIIWGPVAAVFFAQGDLAKGIIVAVVGSLMIGLIDNLLRPRLVASGTKMPDYLILLSTLGGLSWFGLSGFVIGPIIAAFFITCWQMMGEEYSNDNAEADTI